MGYVVCEWACGNVGRLSRFVWVCIPWSINVGGDGPVVCVGEYAWLCGSLGVFRSVVAWGRRKKKIPYKEGNLKNIGDYFWYTVLFCWVGDLSS